MLFQNYVDIEVTPRAAPSIVIRWPSSTKLGQTCTNSLPHWKLAENAEKTILEEVWFLLYFCPKLLLNWYSVGLSYLKRQNFWQSQWLIFATTKNGYTAFFSMFLNNCQSIAKQHHHHWRKTSQNCYIIGCMQFFFPSPEYSYFSEDLMITSFEPFKNADIRPF